MILNKFYLQIYKGTCRSKHVNPKVQDTRIICSRLHLIVLTPCCPITFSIAMCAMSKTQCTLPVGKLVPLPVPPWPWSHISTDFLTALPNYQSHISNHWLAFQVHPPDTLAWTAYSLSHSITPLWIHFPLFHYFDWFWIDSVFRFASATAVCHELGVFSWSITFLDCVFVLLFGFF